MIRLCYNKNIGAVFMVYKEQIYITPFQLYRTLHIYLPSDYKESQEKYPVMYMFDGHNLFHDEEATYGKSWGLQKFLDSYSKPFIIVGIECNHEGNERLNEFSPYTFSSPLLGNVYGKGDQLMDWLVHELKPWIDRRLRTMPFRECTGIAGSSMGGLMALYGVLHYNTIFSKAACLSSAIFGCKEKVFAELQNASLSPDTRIYLSLGTKETSQTVYLNQNIEDMQLFTELLVKKGVSAYFHLAHGGHHNEASWEKENPLYFDYLWRQ